MGGCMTLLLLKHMFGVASNGTLVLKSLCLLPLPRLPPAHPDGRVGGQGGGGEIYGLSRRLVKEHLG